MSPRLCAYTTLLGGYEALNEQPVASRSGLPFLCLTDDPSLRSETWQIRVIRPLFPRDPVRSQRELKIRPHAHLPEFDGSLYIDNSLILEQPPEALWGRMDPAVGMLLPRHSFRARLLDEFLAVASAGLDDDARVFEQLRHLGEACPALLEARPFWTALLVRDHRAAPVRALLDDWAAQVHRYSRRDQLSINLACHRAGVAPGVLEIDNYRSEFHRWPEARNRCRAPAELLEALPEQGPEPAPGANPAVAGAVAALHAEMAALRRATAEHAAGVAEFRRIEASFAWRLAVACRRLIRPWTRRNPRYR